MENKEYFEIMIKTIVSNGGEKFLNKLGEGFSRVAYEIVGTDYVLKIAKTAFGIAQSTTELEAYETNLFEGLQIPIIYHSENNEFLIVAKAKPHHSDKDSSENETSIGDILEEDSDTYNNILRIIKKAMNGDMGYFRRDLVKLSSWGKYQGKDVLLDCGWTINTNDNAYEIENSGLEYDENDSYYDLFNERSYHDSHLKTFTELESRYEFKNTSIKNTIIVNTSIINTSTFNNSIVSVG